MSIEPADLGGKTQLSVLRLNGEKKAVKSITFRKPKTKTIVRVASKQEGLRIPFNQINPRYDHMPEAPIPVQQSKPSKLFTRVLSIVSPNTGFVKSAKPDPHTFSVDLPTEEEKENQNSKYAGMRLVKTNQSIADINVEPSVVRIPRKVVKDSRLAQLEKAKQTEKLNKMEADADRLMADARNKGQQLPYERALQILAKKELQQEEEGKQALAKAFGNQPVVPKSESRAMIVKAEEPELKYEEPEALPAIEPEEKLPVIEHDPVDMKQFTADAVLASANLTDKNYDSKFADVDPEYCKVRVRALLNMPDATDKFKDRKSVV